MQEHALQASLRGAWLQIDLGAIRQNVQNLKRFLKAGTRIMAVVKADAYGHGALMVVPTALEAGAEWLGVATVAEGLKLRSNGINSPILILGLVVPDAYPVAIANGFHLTVSDGGEMMRIGEIATQLNQVANIHLKVDTGMTRVGVLPEEAQRLVQMALTIPNVRLAGFSTHYAKAEDEDGYTERQLAVYRELESSLNLPASVLRHTANSAASVFCPDAHFDMVRPGLLLYGISPEPKRTLPFELKPALSLIARITQLKSVEAGISIGYGGTFVTKRPTRIALLPVGYADGLPRSLSNRQSVVIKGQRCPLLGNISMDQCAVDVTDIEVQVGDQVYLLGGDNGITVMDWAELAGTIPYEIICGLGMRLPKLYSLG